MKKSAVFLGSMLTVLACNDVPVKNLASTYQVQVEELRERGSPAKLDILWVVDDSPSMCQEQQSLAGSFAKFLQVFQKYTAIDMRMAVTTTNFCGPQTCKSDKDCGSGRCAEFKGEKVCLCDTDGDCGAGQCKEIDGTRVCLKSGAVRGRFVYQPAKEFPPECVQKRVYPCLEDSQCQGAGFPDGAHWKCEAKPAQYMYTCDKPAQFGDDPYEGDVLYTINSACRYECDKAEDPARCARTFGEPGSCETMCQGGACSVDTCASAADLVSSTSCTEFCLSDGTDCVQACVDECTTACIDESCPGADDEAECNRQCADGCNTDTVRQECLGDRCSCIDRCQAVLGDPGSCQEICLRRDCIGISCSAIGQDDPCYPVCREKCGDDMTDCQLTQVECIEPCERLSKTLPCGDVCSMDWDCVKKCTAYLGGQAECESVCSSGGECYSTCADSVFPKQDFLCSVVCDSAYECNDRCIAQFGQATYRCLYPGGNKEKAGCLKPPETAYCPDNGPTILDKGVAEKYFEDFKAGNWAGNPSWHGLDDETVKRLIFEQLFICMATVGAAQNICGSQEQGLLAAWSALDRHGENAAQAASFLRDDAFLLIVIVSDEDDCSSVVRLPAIEAGKCACKADTTGCLPDGTCDPSNPGPLYPASRFVNLLKSLKSDPARVLFAAIVGDVIPGSTTSPDTDADKIRDRFYECKCDKGQYAPFTYACLSNQGKADLGSRYMQVAQGFPHGYGQVSNICDDQGLEPALEDIARVVIPFLTNICLPRPMIDKEQIEVYLYDKNGEPHLQVQDEDYFLDQNARNCPIFDPSKGFRTENAIRFARPLERTDRVSIVYRGAEFYNASIDSSSGGNP